MTTAPRAAGFAILFVCTGNVCRSPFAELLTRHLLDQRLHGDATRFHVGSAGTAALVGRGLDPLTSGMLPDWGLARSAGQGHVARQLDERAVRSADLVLTAERHHRAAVANLCPEVRERTFCLREFTRLLAWVGPPGTVGPPVAFATARVKAAAAARGIPPPVTTAEDAIPDPFRRAPGCHRATTTMVGALVTDLVQMITPAH